MKVEIINYTTDALAVLLYTKNTRLKAQYSFREVSAWPRSKKMDHLRYMLRTIQSSWEFVEYTFELSGVSRVLTHQLVRTRTGSYAQESQRTVDIQDSEVTGPNHESFRIAAAGSLDAYSDMVREGMPRQDARYVMPEGTQTSIVAKFSLRTLHDMALVRLCTRTQGEYQKVFRMMVQEVISIHPWAADFLKVHCAWYGRCAFPDYDECPVSEELPMLRSDELGDRAQAVWLRTRHEAVPVAKDGKTMGSDTIAAPGGGEVA